MEVRRRPNGPVRFSVFGKCPSEIKLMVWAEMFGFKDGWVIGHDVRVENNKIRRGSLFVKVWRV